jgi:nucleotide-binding universal stress UspA family protein
MDAHETDDLGIGSSWIKRIVVAADGSAASNRGLEEVGDLAPRIGARVTVVFVRHLPAAALMDNGMAGETVVESLDEVESMVRQEADRILGRTGAAWDYVVRDGNPGEEVVRVVEELDADLVVVGSNRHSSLHNLLLGSTAAHLTAHSPVPVLVMRSKGRPERQPSPSLVNTTS